ncbi:hypothetical protein OS493_017073 [Desmophyllum pertusum]|uniref:Protein DD3-3 n=1 Tax=Desmophyllum pertusum TaxID=174260 RepID=A0A9X0CGA4_9CNID|nr:hypothetical protein OS493_017073 [Desmophyllum pertusum]
MKTIFVWGCLLAVLIEPCMSDIYMHFPPGSNNRLNGNLDNVQNAARLFDSQNNGKAGYNVGDNGDVNPGTNIPEYRQLPMQFYMGGCSADVKSEVEIMWTNQHGTGLKTDDRVESQVILQYMCQEFPDYKFPNGELPDKANVFTLFALNTIRNGQLGTTQGFTNGQRENLFIKNDRGLHEPSNYYQSYIRRDRNKGLFTADQNLGGDQAIFTRQNAGGTRRGLEVPEERDYYPYWGPTPWNDIAVLVSNKKTRVEIRNYVNSPEYGFSYLCIMPTKLPPNADCPPRNKDNVREEKCVAKYINETLCKEAGGEWTKFITNYLERTKGILSTCHSVGETKLKRGYHTNHTGSHKELMERYNITTDDVPREFDASNNTDVQNNPKTKAVDGKTELQLALNTAQLGRTFQDRSHVIILKPRSSLPEKFQHSNIYYIGGMGKRGNIVQAYPAMEYRFTPERLTVTTNDVVCFVWSGSNNNPTGRAGQGTDRTDRTNVCWVKEGCSSLKPAACSSLPLEVVDHVDEFNADKLNLHLNTGCYEGDKPLQNELNNAPASCNPPCFQIKKPGEYCYMGTRNNNFSNRRHIGQITVTAPDQAPVVNGN